MLAVRVGRLADGARPEARPAAMADGVVEGRADDGDIGLAPGELGRVVDEVALAEGLQADVARQVRPLVGS